jgi:hypothetical protein
MRDRFVVQMPCGAFAGFPLGTDWRTRKPTYALTSLDHARLYVQKAGATRCANQIGGKVLRAKIVLEEM